MAGLYFNKKTFCLITGASKGFGRVLAHTLCGKLRSGSKLVVCARNGEALTKLKNEIESKLAITVETIAVDLSAPDETQFEKMIENCLGDSPAESFELALIIHNAGSMCDTSKPIVQLNSVHKLRDYFNFNLISAISMTCAFLKIFGGAPMKLVINISSASAKKPVRSTGLYSTAKAARLMYFRCLAHDEPSIRVLSYEPGGMKTDLFYEFASKTHDKTLQTVTAEMIKGTSPITLLEPEQSAEKLMKILSENKFVNGEQVDYYDNIEEIFKEIKS